jgi:anti-sigma factor RsiW
MEHLSEETLNEMLDEALTTQVLAAAQAHLQHCADCQARLAELQALSVQLAVLAPAPLPRDLAASVLAQIKPPRLALGWRLVLAVQGGVVLGMALLLFSHTLTLPRPGVWLEWALAGVAALQLPDLADIFHFHVVLPAFDLSASGSALLLVVSACLLCGLGNTLLLRNGKAAKR